ncbi:sigma-54-dependent Fis family transcriptional regulator [Acrocarpospora catenulata]|uniref:sigma-54-dependent Fis family transcriptional regulator n=1 Tax=Acrocarpospora catenulata TaxID=2836182 RepID=UPI001BDB4207|nr:helix-turn-helix domain-containing protein [Acrocarpospora catenulata]
MNVDELDPPYRPDVDPGTSLSLAARPVLDRLESALTGTSMTVILTDAHGRVIARRAGDESLNRLLDRIRLAIGFSYAEEYVGTNGIGTALEDKRAAHVFGAEHYSGRLQGMSCAAAPIRHPLSGRIEGVIDLTCRSAHASPLMTALVQGAAADIAQRLLEDSTERERALLTEFLSATRRAARPVVTVSEQLVLTNTAAANLLQPNDQATLRDRALELLGSGRDTVDSSIVLSSGQVARVRYRPVEVGMVAAGAVIEINLHDDPGQNVRVPPRPEAPWGGLAGRHPSWLTACQQVETRCHARTWMLLVGEPGVGKLTVAEAAHRRCFPSSHAGVLDAADCAPDVPAWLDLLRSHLREPFATVILRHVDRLDPVTARRVALTLEEEGEAAGSGAWVTATATDETSAAVLELQDFFPVTVTVPPLRHRIDDLRELAPALLQRRLKGRRVTCSGEAMQLLLRMAWPGNVAELDHVLGSALLRRRAGQIQVGDLPEQCHAITRRILTPLEAIERDAITRALIEASGDKVRAAALLGISRATIYRKIHTYGITVREGTSRVG